MNVRIAPTDAASDHSGAIVLAVFVIGLILFAMYDAWRGDPYD